MNKLSPQKFTTYLFALSVTAYGLLYFLFTRVRPTPNMPLYYMIPMLFVFTSLAYVIMVQTKTKNPRYFVYSFMLISMGRLLMYGGFVFIYALSHREGAQAFAITFFLLYFVYTALEVRAVYGYFKS
jgi:hypothetical protein